MSSRAAASIDALLPLSLLEAVRAVDGAIVDPDTEFVDELRNKRLGMSETVQLQIRRYTDAVRRAHRLEPDEVVALVRLIGRRPDAEAVFAAAGRYLAEHAYDTVPRLARRAVQALPGLLARPVALRQMRRLARRYFNGSVLREGNALLLEIAEPITVQEGDERESGCAYYTVGFTELLRLLVAHGGAVEHVRCVTRAEGACEWRAAWR
jgi:bacteriochlorophyll 4-vinyl reductase